MTEKILEAGGGGEIEERKIIFFDTTLRDGEQSPGASLNGAEKMEIARQLAYKLNVDVIEAGNPISSLEEFEAVNAIAQEIKGPTICALARCVPGDIYNAWEAIKKAEKHMLHIYLGISNSHMQGQLRREPDEVLKMAVSAVEIAKNECGCEEVEFSPMDSGRAFVVDGPEFMYRVIKAVIDAGATVINIPETVGYAFPWEFGEMIRQLQIEIPRLAPNGDVRLSVHCHDDRGTATSMTLEAIRKGVTQVEVCMNGMGERAGNTSLEEIAAAIYYRGDALGGVCMGLNMKEIMNTSRMVSHLMGFPVPPNKALVGKNAFAHSSGVHIDGILKARDTFEIMNPEDIGLKEGEIVLTSRSGRHALRHKLSELEYELSDDQINTAYERFLRVADKKKEIFEEDLVAIIKDEFPGIPQEYSLEYIQSSSGTSFVPTVTIKLKKGDEVITEAAYGSGPVEAAYKAIDKITKLKIELVDYSIHASTKGKDAMGEVIIRIRDNGNTIIGRGANTDIIEASAKAYVNAINKMLHKRKK